MKKEIIVPAAGESVTEADIVSWYKSSGDFVEMDEPLLELETDKASMDLTAEISGILTINVEDGTVQVGDVLGSIEEAEKPASSGQSSSESASSADSAPNGSSDTSSSAPPSSASAAKQETSSSYAAGHPSPAASTVLAEKGIPASAVQGTGRDGRITKEDAQKASVPVAAASGTSSKNDSSSSSHAPQGPRGERTEKMSRLRKTIARRLVEAQHTQAMLTTFNEVDLSAVMDIRKKYKDAFKEKYEVGLGFMSFFTAAVCSALKAHPVLNAAVEGEQIVYRDYCDIGVAVSTPKGLVVPVVRNAEEMNFREIEAEILRLAKKGRDGNLSPDDMTGGTFTITNGGVFGSMLSTPIVNFPQSAILGMHNIVQRPVVVDGEIVIRPMMYLAVSYDHRIIDGSDAVRFLVHIKEQLEDPTRLLIGV